MRLSGPPPPCGQRHHAERLVHDAAIPHVSVELGVGDPRELDIHVDAVSGLDLLPVQARRSSLGGIVANLHQHLADVLALQQAEERLGGVVDTLDNCLAVLDLALA